jgi:hypothetical protein
MADYAETLLPSGRAIRIDANLGVKEYRAAKQRAGNKGAKTGINYQDDLAHELLLTALRAITPSPVPVVMTSPADESPTEFDFDATLEQVPPGAWVQCSYQSLITAGPTSLGELIKAPNDYEAACLFTRQVVTPASPLEVLVMGKKRTVSK